MAGVICEHSRRKGNPLRNLSESLLILINGHYIFHCVHSGSDVWFRERVIISLDRLEWVHQGVYNTHARLGGLHCVRFVRIMVRDVDTIIHE